MEGICLNRTGLIVNITSLYGLALAGSFMRTLMLPPAEAAV